MIFNLVRYIGIGIEITIELYLCLHFTTVGMEILMIRINSMRPSDAYMRQ